MSRSSHRVKNIEFCVNVQPDFTMAQPDHIKNPGVPKKLVIGVVGYCGHSRDTLNATRSVNSKLKLMRKQLILLSQFHECDRRTRDIKNNQSKCNLSYCKTMKEIVEHMINCKLNKDCTVPYCSQSRRIITHWNNCEREHCSICLSLKWTDKCDGNYSPNVRITNDSSYATIQNYPKHLPQQGRHNISAIAPEPRARYCAINQQDFISLEIPDTGEQHKQQQQKNAQQTIPSPQQQRPLLSPPKTFCNPPSQLKEETRTESPHRDKLIGSNAGKLQMQFPFSQVKVVHFTELKKRDASLLLCSIEPTGPKRHRSNQQQYIQQFSQNNQHQNHYIMKFQILNVLQHQQKTEVLQNSMPPSAPPPHQALFEPTPFPFLQSPSSSHLTYRMSMQIPTSKSDIKSSNLILTSNDGSDIFSRPKQSMSIVDSLSSQIVDRDRDKDFYFNTGTNINLGINTEVKDDPISDGIKGDRKPVVTEVTQPIKSDERKYLFKSEELRQALMPTFEKMMLQVPESLAFRQPVDEFFAPNYYEIIHKPMDLSTIRCKLSTGQYSDPWEYVDDVWLMFDNAKLYNKATTRVYRYCVKLVEIFEKEINPVMQTLGYCCGNKHTFRQKKLYCNGKQLCVIPRGAKYFNYERYNFCQKCFLGIPANVIALDDKQSQYQTQIQKSKFMRLTNDHVELEPFVTCLDCGRKQHKICVLHLEKICPDGFVCENCMKKKGAKRKENKFQAKSLPITNLSNYIEARVNNFFKRKEVNIGDVHIRVLSSFNKKVEVKPEMRNRFVKTDQLDSEFSYRGKAIFAFKDLDGVDVCFFGMHVQEYGSDCANPNKRRVYIAYLDSVHFFQPRQYRTDVYHEILLGYLEYVKELGYTIAHIWACPPPEGDDYIFNCHPIDQRIPNSTRLQVWYRKMLEKGKNEQTVLIYEDIFEYAMKNKLNSAAQLPYFEGDFWPNFLEESIIVLDRNQAKKQILAKAAITDKKNNMKCHFKKKKRKKSKKSYISKSAQKFSSHHTGNDLSDRIFTIMEIHKEAFFVIQLHSAQSAQGLTAIQDPDPLINCDLMDGPDGFIALSRDKNFEFSSLRRAKFSTLNMLYELHNHEYNFVFTCNNCKNHMKAGYHCRVCYDYDLCIGCKDIIGHDHEMDKLNDSCSPSDLQKANPEYFTKHLIHQRIEIVAHMFRCRDFHCQIPSCKNTKEVVNHFKSCNRKTNRRCSTYNELIALCCYHAKNCQDDMCPVPYCHNMKTKLKQQQIQQRLQQAQLMNRRMAVMNTGIISATQEPMNNGIGSTSPFYSLVGAANQHQEQHLNTVKDYTDKINSHPNNDNSEMGVLGGLYANRIVNATLPGGDMFQGQRVDLEPKHPKQINKSNSSKYDNYRKYQLHRQYNEMK